MFFANFSIVVLCTITPHLTDRHLTKCLKTHIFSDIGPIFFGWVLAYRFVIPEWVPVDKFVIFMTFTTKKTWMFILTLNIFAVIVKKPLLLWDP